MDVKLDKIKKALAVGYEFTELQERSNQIEQRLSQSDESGVEVALSEYRSWKGALQCDRQALNGVAEDLEALSVEPGVNSGLYQQLKSRQNKVTRVIDSFLPIIERRIENLERLGRDRLERNQAELSRRAVHAAELANTIAADSSTAAKVSASAAKQSAQVAGDGVKLTKKMFWAAVVSALVAVGALIGQIYSQNKDVSVNLNSPVALQPVTLSDESISNLTHAIAVELSKAQGEQVTLSPESIEGLRAVLRLELEKDVRVEVVETKGDVEQKAN
ncbi:hypothetical protein [Microbulbifer sp. JMSA008]|uniref:hypothetical protein n=1 Tax=Microbulbifer sp. JMSA008 TaxID=3243373 RepID=UPI00403A403F